MLLVWTELLRVVRSCPAVLLRGCMHVQHNPWARCCGVVQSMLVCIATVVSIVQHNTCCCRPQEVALRWCIILLLVGRARRHRRIVVVAGLPGAWRMFSGLQVGLVEWLAPPSMHHWWLAPLQWHCSWAYLCHLATAVGCTYQ